ncbi:MAG: FAD-dependent oxidoreductase, partial [archaeon]
MSLENTPSSPISGTYDVIIVGAGPGGSSAGMFLAKKGYKVLLLEKAKYPRDKICGDAISGKSVGMLRELGIEGEMEQLENAKVYGLVFSSPAGHQLEIPFPVKEANGETKARGYVCR